MCVWNVKEEDRLCGFCLYRQCMQRERPKVSQTVAAGRYIEAMLKVSGVNALERTRKREVVWCRNMIALQMCLDGFVQNDIAEALGLGRPTIVHCINSMVDALDSPNQYPVEYGVWQKFREIVANFEQK